jgi:hypothetical protein
LYEALKDSRNSDLVTAISYSDPALAPKNSRITVMGTDTTHGLTMRTHGFGKWSFCFSYSPTHEIELITATALNHENIVTFTHEFNFLLSLYPYLASSRFVLFLDGDPAKIHVARTLFKNVVLILDEYHSTENVKSKLGPLCRSRKTTSTAGTEPNPLLEERADAQEQAISNPVPVNTNSNSQTMIMSDSIEHDGNWKNRDDLKQDHDGLLIADSEELVKDAFNSMTVNIINGFNTNAYAWIKFWRHIRDSPTLEHARFGLFYLKKPSIRF